jgi:tRNA-2-methylthio-N6-dimethylallyladenosine synthase
MSGRSENNRVVNFSGQPRLIGTFVDVRITEAFPNSLRGEVLMVDDQDDEKRAEKNVATEARMA